MARPGGVAGRDRVDAKLLSELAPEGGVTHIAIVPPIAPREQSGLSACRADRRRSWRRSARCPALRLTAEANPGAAPPTVAPSRIGRGATATSARFRSIAEMTARATSSGDRVPTPGGKKARESANIPASRMKPGRITETPTRWGRRSSRKPSANPRNPNFVAE